MAEKNLPGADIGWFKVFLEAPGAVVGDAIAGILLAVAGLVFFEPLLSQIKPLPETTGLAFLGVGGIAFIFSRRSGLHAEKRRIEREAAERKSLEDRRERDVASAKSEAASEWEGRVKGLEVALALSKPSPSSREDPVDVTVTRGTIRARAIGSVRTPTIDPVNSNGKAKFDCQVYVDFFGVSPFRPSPETLRLMDRTGERTIATLRANLPTQNPDIVFYRAIGDWSDILSTANVIFPLGDGGKFLLLELSIHLPEGYAHEQSGVKLDFELTGLATRGKDVTVPVFVFKGSPPKDKPSPNEVILAETPDKPLPRILKMSGGTA